MTDPSRLDGRAILVVGLGRSGVASARLCAARGAVVTVTDRRAEGELGPDARALPAAIRRELGHHREASFTGADLVVLSPGVPPLPEVAAARARGVPVTGELELGSWFIDAPLVAITGTNGKSTTTTLCGEMLARGGRPVFVGGNLGTPLCEAVGTPAASGAAGGACVVEVSSFQLETTVHFRPRVAVLLNVTPDHLDRYPDFDGYAAAKARIFAAQGVDDFAVINADDPVVAQIASGLRACVVSLSTRRPLDEGGWVSGDVLQVRLPGSSAVERYPASAPGLFGRHNQENALAAILTARLCGASEAEVRAALLAFRPLAHRMELVAERAGVAYFDDSKGTNVGAVVAALTGFPRPVVLIAGGRDKGGSYAPLAGAMTGARGAVLIGEAAERIREALAPVVPVEVAGSLEDAVARASRMARAGDAVVLSPACSSFDMFRDYAHRAEIFRQAVERLGARP